MKKNLFFPCFAFIALTSLTGCNPGGGGKGQNFTVKFETYGGTPKPDDQIVKEGNYATRPSEDPIIAEAEGYTFDDWYVSPEGMDKFNFSNPITCNTTVYAHYNGGYTIYGKTNVDYNDFSDDNLTFKVKNRDGQEETGFKYNVYFPDFKTGVCIDDNGRLVLGDENIYLYGYVYATRENSKSKVEYDYAYKRIQIASFDCLEYTETETPGNYKVSPKSSYPFSEKSSFKLCIPEIYYDEVNKVIKGSVTKVNGEFGSLLATTTGYPDIYISDSIEEIGDNAFAFENGNKCPHIMHISKGIKKIGNNAFKYCNGDGKPTFDFDFSDTKLERIGDFAFLHAHLEKKYIKFPKTLSFIGDEAFYVGEYRRPNYIEFADTSYWVKNDDLVMNILDVSDKNKNVDYFSPKDFSVPNYAKGIQKAVINQGALSFGEGSKQNTLKVIGVDETKLEEFGGGTAKEFAVTIPDTVTLGSQTYTVNEISSGAFKGKTTINNVYLSDNIEKIGDEAFSDCSSLRSIHITKNVKSIGEKVFDNCYSLVSMSVDSENNTYGSSAIKGFYHPAILSKDGSILYYGCKSISDLDENRTFPQKVKVIKSHAFYGRYNNADSNSGIKGNIKFPASLVHIEQDAFYSAFNFNKYISTSYKIEFDSITKLWTISKDGKVAQSGVKVNIADDNLANFQKYSDHEWKYKEEGSNLAYIDSQYSKTSEVKGLGECTDTDIVIPNMHSNYKVTRVREGAFKGKDNIKSVSIGDNVAYFESSVFENCTLLKELILPKSVKEFGNPEYVSSPRPHYIVRNSIFNGCTSLNNIYMEDYDSTWEYGTYDIKQTEIGYTAEFSKIGTHKFDKDSTKNAAFFKSDDFAKYAWRKAN